MDIDGGTLTKLEGPRGFWGSAAEPPPPLLHAGYLRSCFDAIPRGFSDRCYTDRSYRILARDSSETWMIRELIGTRIDSTRSDQVHLFPLNRPHQ
jgi:hypothetical protein